MIPSGNSQVCEEATQDKEKPYLPLKTLHPKVDWQQDQRDNGAQYKVDRVRPRQAFPKWIIHKSRPIVQLRNALSTARSGFSLC